VINTTCAGEALFAYLTLNQRLARKLRAIRVSSRSRLKEGKYALNWTRLPCHDSADNLVRLQLFALAYNLTNFLRRLALPSGIRHWSLTTLKEKLIKVGVKVIRHAGYLTFQMAEVASVATSCSRSSAESPSFDSQHHVRLQHDEVPALQSPRIKGKGRRSSAPLLPSDRGKGERRVGNRPPERFFLRKVCPHAR
jgi:Transposase DDE domain group 1